MCETPLASLGKRTACPTGSDTDNSAIERGIILAEDVDLRMANPNSSARLVWQKNPLFCFFASLKLAVVLLTMLIIAAIAGTLYESSFDAKVARGYVYGAPWFNLWLVLLGANLACSALSRWPCANIMSRFSSRISVSLRS